MLLRFNKYLVFLFPILLHSIYSCTMFAEKHEVKTQQLFLPDTIEVYNINIADTLSFSHIKQARFNIYTLIDASCASCLQKLYYWNDFAKNNKIEDRVSVIPVCGAKDRFESFKYLFESGQLKDIMIPLVLDIAGTFRIRNPNLDMSVTAFLTDASNTVLLTGNPVTDKNDEATFLKMMR